MPTPIPEGAFREVCELWSQGRITQAEAAARLGVSTRTFRRHLTRFGTEGARRREADVRHRRHDRWPPPEEWTRLETLYSEHYRGWNVRHFYEKYRDEHGGCRSYTWVKKVLQTAGLVERRSRKGTSERSRRKPPPESIGRRPREGILIHQIAARHEWSPGLTCDLVLAMDDATNRVHSGFLVAELGIWSVFKGIRETLEQGIFRSLCLRVALPVSLAASESTFGGRTRDQLERAASEAGIELLRPGRRLCSRSMRMIQTLRGRLPRELAAEGIGEIDRANGFLAGFWSRFNEALGKAPGSPTAFASLAPDIKGEFVDILCLKHAVRIRDGNRLFCKGREIELPLPQRQQLSTGREYRIHEYEGGTSKLFSRETGGLIRPKWEESRVTSHGPLKPGESTSRNRVSRERTI